MAAQKVIREYADKLLRLTDALRTHTDMCFARSEKTVRQRMPLLRTLKEVICSEHSNLVTVGSAVTKLSCDEKTDLDLSFVSYNENFWRIFHRNVDFRMEFMNTIQRMLLNSRLKMTEITPFYYTNVPIIIAHFEDGSMVDIQFPTHIWHSIRNTHLVRAYVLADVRFAQLYFYVRTLFETLGLRNSREHLFSSYHIVCLVMHFLHRVDSPEAPIVPVIFKDYNEKFNVNVPVRDVVMSNMLPDEKFSLGWKSENNKSVGELVAEFFHYYANEFDPLTKSILLRDGTVVDKRNFADGRGGRLIICDPYSNHTVCRSNVIVSLFNPTFTFIWEAISKNGEFLESFPLFTHEKKKFYEIFNSEPWGRALLSNTYGSKEIPLQELSVN